REVVDRGDLVAVAESIDKMGADEARASGDQDPLPLHRIEATGTSDIMFPLRPRLGALLGPQARELHADVVQAAGRVGILGRSGGRLHAAVREVLSRQG